MQMKQMPRHKKENGGKGMKSLAESLPPIDPPVKKTKGKQPPPGVEAEPVAPKQTAAASVMGRPSTFDPSYVGEAEYLCKLGATEVELAEFFGAHLRTIKRWQVTYPEFAKAMTVGKGQADDRVQSSLYHRALGTEVEEMQAIKLKRTKYDEKGRKTSEEEYIEMVPVKRVIPADTTAIIFWLKNRRRQEWRDVHKIEHGQAGEFDGASEQELEKYIEQEVKALQIVDDTKPKH